MKSSRRIVLRLVAWLWGALVAPDLALAATNAARGGIGGIDNGTLVDGGGTGRAQIIVDAVDLALTKQARDMAGTVLPDGAAVTPGQEIYFVLFVDNPTVAEGLDLQLTDPLDETQFAYVAGSLEWSTVPTGSTDAQIWSGSWIPLTDVLGAPDDIACAADVGGAPGADLVTVGATPGQVNAPARVPAQSIMAVRFRVRVR